MAVSSVRREKFRELIALAVFMRMVNVSDRRGSVSPSCVGRGRDGTLC